MPITTGIPETLPNRLLLKEPKDTGSNFSSVSSPVTSSDGYVTWEGTTTDATPTELFVNSNRYAIADGEMIAVLGLYAARDSLGNVSYINLQFAAKNVLGTVTITDYTLDEIGVEVGMSTIDIDVIADSVNETVNIEVTGKALLTINHKLKTIINLV